MLPQILEWSTSLPDWQRDALRRIVLHRDLSEMDVEELAEFCKKRFGLSVVDGLTAPLTADHVPGEGARASVSLKALTHVGDVNALAPGQSLTFGATGLTVVYGDNGAGKSGYSRILKRACRARGNGEAILPNALSEAPGGTPRADIVAVVDGTDSTFSWRDGTPGPDALAAVSVFDTASAHVYVSNKTEVAFRPSGLDVLDRLADAVNRVRDRLERERGALERSAVVLPVVRGDTAVAKLLGSLSGLTSKENVEELASVTEAERAELQRLRDLVAAARAYDPKKRANEVRARAARARKVAKHVGDVNRYLDRRAVARLEELRRNIADTSAAAAVALAAGKGHPLPGVGGALWRSLWDSARKFGEAEVHRGFTFPHVEGGALCVLCQQGFSDDAQARMLEFQRLVGDATQQALDAARDAIEKARAALAALNPSSPIVDAVDEIGNEDPALADSVRGFMRAADETRSALLAGLDAETQLGASPETPPLSSIEEFAAALESKADEIARAAEPQAIVLAEASVAELEARLELAAVKDTVVAEIERRARINAYVTCLREARTNAVTIKSTELTKTHVTDALAGAFENELKRLGFEQPELALRAVGGQKGALLHQIQLKHATKAELFRIVSEGEARCLALAAFLSDLTTASHRSSIIFDDPVSSLDHRWRSRVALRLVEEAKVRQVVVFTHELAFLFDLTKQARLRGIACQARSIRRARDHAGFVDDDLPWKGLNTKKRIGWMRNEWQAVEKLHRTSDVVEYERRATSCYAKLRQAWEHAVAEELLNNVVIRFDDGVHTQSLMPVSEEQIRAVHIGMTKASKWEGGHDHASTVNEPVPSPSELKGDIDALDGWFAALAQRPKLAQS